MNKNFVVSIALLSINLLYPQVVNGQEVNSTEEASKNAKEILCNKYYELEYCEGQEVNNNLDNANSTNSTNSTTTTRPNPKVHCFRTYESHDIFSPYYSWSRCN